MNPPTAKESLVSTLRDICTSSAKLEQLDIERVSVQQALERARALYEQLMAESSSALLLVDANGAILASNHAAESLLGYGPEELRSMTLPQLYDDDAAHELRLTFDTALNEGAAGLNNAASIRKDRQPVRVDTSLVAVSCDKTTLVQVVLRRGSESQKIRIADKRYIRGLELLARSATRLLESAGPEELYHLVAAYSAKIAGQGYAIVSSYNESSRRFFVRDIAGPRQHGGIPLADLVRHLVGASFVIGEEEFKRYLTSCTPVSVSGGLHRLFSDRLPEHVYRAMEDVVLSGSTYVAGLVAEGEVFAMAAILMPKGMALDHPALVAALMQQASAVLKHRTGDDAGRSPARPEHVQTFVGDLKEAVPEELSLPLPPQVEGDAEEQEGEAEPEVQPHREAKTCEVIESHVDQQDFRNIFVQRKILVVDNEEIVRDVTGGMLNFMGCKVGYARNGLEAVARYKNALEAGAPFDAVIVDVSLSGGPDAAQTMNRLKQIHSGVKALATNHKSNALMMPFKELGFGALVVRPYKSRDLVSALQHVLSNGRPDLPEHGT